MEQKINITKVSSFKVFETFAGIGAQHKAIRNQKLPWEVVKISEWDARAIIAYASIHHSKELSAKLKEVKKWEPHKVNNYLFNKTFSLNSKKLGRIISKPLDFKQILIAANEVNNNFPDIKGVKGKDLKDIDLLTYSFPCQGLSVANMGRDQGIKEDSDSTSNLIWEIHRILLEAKKKEKIKLPKYLLMENVENLLNTKYEDDYEEWKRRLEQLGYKTYTLKLNAFNFGSLQKRKRVFGISILNYKKQKWKNDDELKAFLEKEYGWQMTIEQRKENYLKIFKSSSLQEKKDATPNNTESRRRMKKDNKHLLEIKECIKGQWTFHTLTTKQDRHPNIGMIKNKFKNEKNKLDYRFITPREAYQIMEFTNQDFNKVLPWYEKRILTKESLYRQAGNSIVVNVLEAIFKFINDFEGGKYE